MGMPEPAVQNLVEVGVEGVVVAFAVSGQAQLFEEHPAHGPGVRRLADPGGHVIQALELSGHVQIRVGVRSDQKARPHRGGGPPRDACINSRQRAAGSTSGCYRWSGCHRPGQGRRVGKADVDRATWHRAGHAAVAAIRHTIHDSGPTAVLLVGRHPGEGRVELAEFEAMSFDCYGTLIDWEAGLAAVLSPWARRRGLDVERRTASDRLFRSRGRGRDRITRPSATPTSWRGACGRSGRTSGRVSPTEDGAALARSVPDWPAFADSHDAPRPARPGAPAHHSLQCGPGVVRLFERPAGRDLRQHPHRRGHRIRTSRRPRNFEALEEERRRLGVSPGKLVHVAQSLFHDHIPAQQAGLPTVWINRRHDRPGWGATPAPSGAVTSGLGIPIDGVVRSGRRRQLKFR